MSVNPNPSGAVDRGRGQTAAKGIVVALALLLVTSCSHAPSTKAGGQTAVKPVKAAAAESAPNDVKVINGVEYVYVPNPRYMSEPGQPEYIWWKKDEYAKMSERRERAEAAEKKELEALRERVEKLEEEVRKRTRPR